MGRYCSEGQKHNDFSVFLCAGLGYDNNLYIIDVKRGKWEAPELLKEAKAFINKHKDSNTKIGKLRYMAVEDKASGTGLIQSISRKLPYLLGQFSGMRTNCHGQWTSFFMLKISAFGYQLMHRGY